MHELALVRSICTIINEKVREFGVSSVVQVKLVIGALTGVEDTTLKACFEVYVQESPLAGAVLAIERVPIKVRCRECGNEYETGLPFAACAVCGNKAIKIIAGKEFYIDSLEVE
jgi:hydrogenase nickel incorporation protein HypA/HybF